MTDQETKTKIAKWYQEDCYSWEKLFWWIDQITELPQFKRITPKIVQRIIDDGLAKY